MCEVPSGENKRMSVFEDGRQCAFSNKEKEKTRQANTVGETRKEASHVGRGPTPHQAEMKPRREAAAAAASREPEKTDEKALEFSVLSASSEAEADAEAEAEASDMLPLLAALCMLTTDEATPAEAAEAEPDEEAGGGVVVHDSSATTWIKSE